MSGLLGHYNISFIASFRVLDFGVNLNCFLEVSSFFEHNQQAVACRACYQILFHAPSFPFTSFIYHQLQLPFQSLFKLTNKRVIITHCVLTLAGFHRSLSEFMANANCDKNLKSIVMDISSLDVEFGYYLGAISTLFFVAEYNVVNLFLYYSLTDMIKFCILKSCQKPCFRAYNFYNFYNSLSQIFFFSFCFWHLF